MLPLIGERGSCAGSSTKLGRGSALENPNILNGSSSCSSSPPASLSTSVGVGALRDPELGAFRGLDAAPTEPGARRGVDCTLADGVIDGGSGW